MGPNLLDRKDHRGTGGKPPEHAAHDEPDLGAYRALRDERQAARWLSTWLKTNQPDRHVVVPRLPEG